VLDITLLKDKLCSLVLYTNDFRYLYMAYTLHHIFEELVHTSLN